MIIKNVQEMSNEAMVSRFGNAITWEKCDMALTLNADAIKKQEAIISNDDSTPDEIKVAQSKLEALQAECVKIKSQQESVAEDYTTVLTAISSAHNDHAQNNETAVRNILRLSCCDDNSKFFKYPEISSNGITLFAEICSVFASVRGVVVCVPNV